MNEEELHLFLLETRNAFWRIYDAVSKGSYDEALLISGANLDRAQKMLDWSECCLNTEMVDKHNATKTDPERT